MNFERHSLGVDQTVHVCPAAILCGQAWSHLPVLIIIVRQAQADNYHVYIQSRQTGVNLHYRLQVRHLED